MIIIYLLFILPIPILIACPLKCHNNTQTSKQKCYKTTNTSITRTLVPTITTTVRTSIIRTTVPSTTVSSSVIRTTTVSSTTTINPISVPTLIPITTGKTATLTYFTDTVTQCYGGNIPPGNGLAINPLLLGFTLNDWNTKYANADPNIIPWCGKMMNVTVNGRTYVGRVIDTCNPGDDGAFIDPNTGLVIGGKCDYVNVIDLYSTAGLNFLQNTVGDDFYQGNVEWVIY